MNKFINKTKIFIFTQQKSIFSSAVILAIMIIVSRMFGFLRYRILAGYFPKEQLDIFFASFRIPDLIFEILITGAFTTSFIPIYIKYQKNKKELTENISSIINLIFLLMTGFIIITLLCLNRLIPLITPGYPSSKTEKIIFYSRFLLLGQLPFFILGNFLTGISQANKIFLLSALAPIIYNFTIILFTLFLTSSISLMAPIIGVIVGAFIFFIIQLPILHQANFNFSLILKKTSGMIEFIRMVIPRTLTTIVAQIEATIDLTLTTLVGSGAYTIFYFAQHLQLLPVSIFGIAFGQASLPYLSELFNEKKIEEFKKIIVDSILNLFFVTIPIASFFIFARTPLVRLFFGGQRFDWEATIQTALTLSWFSISIPFHSIYYFLSRCFYAILDSKTPFYISSFSILLNLCISLVLILVLKVPVWGLAIAFSFSITINVFLLLLIFRKRIGDLNFNFLVIESLKIASATFFASVFSYYLIKLLDGLVLDTTRTINIFILLVISSSSYFFLYLFLGWSFDIKQIYLISKLLTKFKEYQKRIGEIYTSYE